MIAFLLLKKLSVRLTKSKAHSRMVIFLKNTMLNFLKVLFITLLILLFISVRTYACLLRYEKKGMHNGKDKNNKN